MVGEAGIWGTRQKSKVWLGSRDGKRWLFVMESVRGLQVCGEICKKSEKVNGVLITKGES